MTTFGDCSDIKILPGIFAGGWRAFTPLLKRAGSLSFPAGICLGPWIVNKTPRSLFVAEGYQWVDAGGAAGGDVAGG